MTSPSALVGCTGLVGGNLVRERSFDVLVNSSNADVLRGGRFDHVVFSAARAEKWRANAQPEADQRHIAQLIELLRSFRADRLTLVSTVDVYPEPTGVDESSGIDPARLHQYGRGRHLLESAALEVQPRTVVVRLPALHGPGLKKNVIFDLLNDNLVDRIQPASRFQYYDLTRLADDIDLVWQHGLDVVNLVTEPVSTAEVAAQVFGRRDALGDENGPAIRYDVRSLHAERFGGSDGWFADRDEVLRRLQRFVMEERAGRAEGAR